MYHYLVIARSEVESPPLEGDEASSWMQKDCAPAAHLRLRFARNDIFEPCYKTNLNEYSKTKSAGFIYPLGKNLISLHNQLIQLISQNKFRQ